MITVTIGRRNNDENFVLSCKGHCRPDVCCAATSYGYLLAQTVLRMYDMGKLRSKPRVQLKEGDIYVLAKPNKADYAECLYAFYMIRTGYQLLMHSYENEIYIVDSMQRTQSDS